MARYVYTLPSATRDLALYRGRTPTSSERTRARNAIIAWDTETTGFGPEDRIIAIALREVFVSEPRELRLLINPGKGIPNRHVHGISNRMVRRKPHFAKVWPRIRKFVEDCASRGEGKPILIAHNAEFDIDMLKRELERLEMAMPDWHFACSINHVSKPVWPRRESYKLAELLKMLRIENEEEHRALGDARALCRLIEKAEEYRYFLKREQFDNKYRTGDAMRSLILQKLMPASNRRNKNIPVTARNRNPKFVPVVFGGGFFCTRGGAAFHVDRTCRGLWKSDVIYEVAGPPSDRRECRMCSTGAGAGASGKPAALQIEKYLRSARGTLVPVKVRKGPLRASSRKCSRIVARVVPGGGFFCTEGGAAFHIDHHCQGLQRSDFIYEVAGPPVDRRECRICAAGFRMRMPRTPRGRRSRNVASAASQIQSYLL